MKTYLLFKTECKKFRKNERYSLRAGTREVIAVVPVHSTGMTIPEITAEIGEFRVEMYFYPGMGHYEKGEGNFYKA